MKLQNLLFAAVLIILISACGKQETTSLGGWDYEWMTQVKSDLNNGETFYLPAYENLITEAGQDLEGGVYSVTFKKMIPPSGSKNDYMSMGPYWWPDPEQPDGLPYIRRDGEVNSERDKLDRLQLGGMINGVRRLSLAWFFSGKDDYAEKAAELLRVWFLNPETLMNPHLNYGQAIPGRTEGRFIGIIDARQLHILVDAIALIETLDVLDEAEINNIRAWFEEYFTWLTESQFGISEENYRNNHSVAFDVQACGIAYYLEKDEYVSQKVSETPERRIDPMIEEDGSQPHELIRTRAYSYSVGNLRNFFDVADKGLKVGVNIYDYVNPDGGSLIKALEYLKDYIGREDDWPYEQISGWDQTENNLALLIRRAAHVYDREDYQIYWEDNFYDRTKAEWDLLVFPGN